MNHDYIARLIDVPNNFSLRSLGNPSISCLTRVCSLLLFLRAFGLVDFPEVTCTDGLWKREERRPAQGIFILPTIQTMTEPDSPGYVEIGPEAGHQMPNPLLILFPDIVHFQTHHQPCPSNRIPHGRPICLLQLRSDGQYALSRFHIRNPPRNIDKPVPIMVHIVDRILASRRSLTRDFSRSFTSIERLRCSLNSSSLFVKDGRKVNSMTYTLRNKTIAVRMAYAFWWKEGS